jgi:hypothetical protein
MHSGHAENGTIEITRKGRQKQQMKLNVQNKDKSSESGTWAVAESNLHKVSTRAKVELEQGA